MRHQHIATDNEKWPHLQDVPFPQVEQQNISPTIGTNVPEAFVPLDVCHGNPNDPISIGSCLGFAVLSRTGDGTTQQSHDVYHIHTTTDGTSLDRQVESFWKTNMMGDHYSMGLLWKHDPPDLPFNRSMAEIRLPHLKQCLQTDRDLHGKYCLVVDDYIAKGHARKLTKEETVLK